MPRLLYEPLMVERRLLLPGPVRNVARMAAATQRKEPLVAIMGTTGTGKSDLAVDLAVRFNGEIINADAMQMYKGLPVVTNQITVEEQRGIPHHLLATVELDQPTWTISLFRREAARLIQEIRGRGKLPIVVGGTHYYINALLFENSLAESRDPGSEFKHVDQVVMEQEHPILAGPTDLILQRLREVDPTMANRWHPEDRRKIKRSLEIFMTTGRKASDIYAEQQEAKAAASDLSQSPWQTLMFWVYTQPDVLKERLDKRIEKMKNIGLMDEIRSLHEHLRRRTEAGEDVDRSRGVWQSIGFKQFEPFLNTERSGGDATKLERMKVTGLEDMKIATRQYARQQLRWIRTKTIPPLQERAKMGYLYLLDSSNAQTFSGDVLLPAGNILQEFLADRSLPDPSDMSETASDVFSSFHKSFVTPKPVFQAQACEVCNMTLVSDDQWQKHVKGKRHRWALRRQTSTALARIDDVEPIGQEVCGTERAEAGGGAS